VRFLLIVFLFLATLNADPVDVAKSYLGETENLGSNRSLNIDKWNRAAGVPVGSYWCASFVSFCYKEAGYHAPYSAYSPDFFKRNLVPFSDIKRNDAVGFYFSSKGRIAHIGLIEGSKGNYIVTVEGNTSGDDKIDRNGGGVYRKYRSKKLLDQRGNKFSRWGIGSIQD